MIAPYSGSYADQLFFEGQAPPMPSAPFERQVPVPPPPLGATQPPIPSPASINSVLQALLPLLGKPTPKAPLSSFGGGSEEGGHGSNLLLPFLLSSLGGGGGGAGGGLVSEYAPGLARSFAAIPYSVPSFLLRSGKGHSQKRMLAQRAVSDHGSQIALLKCSPIPRPKVCDDMPFDKILTIGDAILAIKGQNVYRFDTDGNPVDDQPFELDPALRGLLAAVSIKGSDYLFQGDRYHKYRNGLKPGLSTIEFRRIKSGFPGLMSPIDGVFQLNNHTFIAVSAFYPDEKLPVKPSDEVRSLNEISGAPPTVDSVFFMNNRT
ncbi:hypothetical protein RvY_02814 [Ramazzottius varieornatus]|uniref:Uncharacterized protein n=1 Tax=Ramazzottius varieornatus TaxID=947166 RepID=A0A1D1UL18_RAMVA|nr:hypothetical protein RvY_02814 [Ramazzottius varieornatus]